MSDILEKLRQLINSSSVPTTDQNDLLIFLPILPEELLKNLCQFFEKNPKLIKDFNENFKAKLKVLIDGRDAWDKMIEQEEEMFEKTEKEEEEEEEEEEEKEPA